MTLAEPYAEPPIALLSYADLVKRKGELVTQDLVLALRDGRAIIRANAALGLAALDHTGRDLLPFLRDSEALVAQSAAEALLHLKRAQREHLVPIAAALDGARPEVVDTVIRMFAELVGQADVELVGVLDTADSGAANAVVEGCARVGVRGLHLLQAAARDERALVRLNAVRGVGRLAYLEPVSSIEIMQRVASEDTVSDVRAGALAALAAYMARSRAEAAAKAGEPIPSKVPALMVRALTPDELRVAATGARRDELLAALDDPRVEIRLNAVRVLALRGAAAGDSAPALAVATRDLDPTIRLESVRVLAALARTGVVAAPALACALGDADPAVVAAAEAALAEQGAAVAQTLVDSLEVESEVHGARVAGLIGRLPDGPSRLREALASTSIDVRVNAALGLAALGKARAGAALVALSAAARGGNARVRAAVAKAVATLDPRPERSLPPLAIDGFEQRVLAEADLAKQKDALSAAGVVGLTPRLADARAVVRANTALGLSMVGGDAAGVADALAACLRDDDAEVRMSAARALARLGEPAITACAHDLVRALRGADAALTAQLVAMIRAHDHAAIDAALVRALDTTDDHHARQICELVCARPAAVDLLCDAFERPGAQANAARGFAMLGKDKLGKGRALLERARTASEARVRDLAQATLLAIDGRPARSLPPLAIDGFEQRVLAEADLAKQKDALAAAGVAGLVARLADARAPVRANVALGLGILGGDPVTLAAALAACLRDDAAEVRMSAARALARLGEPAVAACAHDVVRALRGADAALTAQLVAMIRAHDHAAIGAALVRALDSTDDHHARQLCELVCARPAAVDLLCDAFERPGAQANAARGFAILGKDKLGKGRALLERARTAIEARVRELAHATLLAIDGPPVAPAVPAIAGFETALLEKSAFAGASDVGALLAFLNDGRAVVRANAATALGTLGPAAAGYAITIAALLRDDDDRVRIAAAQALDQLGDEAVVSAAPYMVSALRGDARLAEVCRTVLAARKSRVEAALVAGLETPDQVHGMRIADLICALPNARDLLFAAFDGEAQNVQINAAFGIAKLGAKRAGPDGRQRLLNGLPGPPTRRRDAMLKALAMLGESPPR